MSDGTETEWEMTDSKPSEDAPEEAAQENAPEQAAPKEQSFTQADVDRIVRERVDRERKKFSDYDELKAKAGEARTAEERIAKLEQMYQGAEAQRLRADIASRYGITPEDRDLFLTGADEEQLEVQAQRLSERLSEQSAPRRPQPHPAQNQGDSPVNDKDAQARAFFGI